MAELSPEEMPPEAPVMTVEAPAENDSADTQVPADDAASPTVASDSPVSDVTAPQFRNAQGQFTAAPVADAPASPSSEQATPEAAPDASAESADSAPPAEAAPEETDAEKIARLTGELAQADAQVENLLGIIALSQQKQEPVPADADTSAPDAPAADPTQINTVPDPVVNPLQAENDHLKQQLADQQRLLQQATDAATSAQAAYERIRDAHGTANGAAPADAPVSDTEAMQSRLDHFEAENAHLKEQIVHLQNAQPVAELSAVESAPVVLSDEALAQIKTVVDEALAAALPTIGVVAATAPPSPAEPVSAS
jgi:hypothetical protein